MAAPKDAVSWAPSHSMEVGLGVHAFSKDFEEHFNVSTKRINAVLRQMGEPLEKHSTMTSTSSNASMTPQMIEHPQYWGLRTSFVTQLWEYVAEDMKEYAASHWIDEDYRHVCVCPACGWHHSNVEHVSRAHSRGALRKMETNMRLVVDRYVKPWTTSTGYGLAVVLNSGYASEYRKGASLVDLCKATVFISHSWQHDFEEFVQSLKLSLFMNTVVWICSFAIWQHGDISGLVSNLAESPFARALKSCESVLVVSNQTMSVFERCWVVLEAALALEYEKDYHISFPDAGLKLGEDFWSKLATLDMVNCGASVLSDKVKIIEYVQECLGGLEHLNTRVQSRVKHAVEEAEVMFAAMNGDVDSLKKAAGSLKTWRSMRGRGVIHLSAEYSHAGSVVEILDNIGLDQIDVVDHHGSTPLSVAARRGALASVACLLSLRANVNSISEGDGGLTPLHYGVMQGHRKVSHLLVASRADLQIEACYLDTTGRRPLDIAIREGYSDLVKDILVARADVRKPSSNGAHPLFVAAANGHARIVTLLLNRKANINARTLDEFGRTALTRSVMSGHASTSHLLLAHKADPNVEDALGNSAAKVLDDILTKGSKRVSMETARGMYGAVRSASTEEFGRTTTGTIRRKSTADAIVSADSMAERRTSQETFARSTLAMITHEKTKRSSSCKAYCSFLLRDVSGQQATSKDQDSDADSSDGDERLHVSTVSNATTLGMILEDTDKLIDANSRLAAHSIKSNVEDKEESFSRMHARNHSGASSGKVIINF